jgi:hypothetical protein
LKRKKYKRGNSRPLESDPGWSTLGVRVQVIGRLPKFEPYLRVETLDGKYLGSMGPRKMRALRRYIDNALDDSLRR